MSCTASGLAKLKQGEPEHFLLGIHDYIRIRHFRRTNHLLSVSGNPSGSFFVFRHPHMQASSSVVHIALLLICAALLGPNLVVNAKACGRLGESCPSYYACSFDTYCEPSVNKCLARKPPGSSCKYDSDCAPAAEPGLPIQQASCFAVASGPSTISNICTVANLFQWAMLA